MQEYYDKPGILLNELIEDDEDEIFYEEYLFLQSTLKDLAAQLRGGPNTQIDFIGAHPISLSRAKYISIKQNPNDWLVCEKTDGVRYLMIILSNGHVYLTGRNVGGLVSAARKFQLFRINMKLPSVLVTQKSLQIIEMFDGELIIDKYPKEQRLFYLIFDALIHNSRQVVDFTYFERLRAAQEFQEMKKIMVKLNGKADQDLQQLKFFPKIKCILKDFFQINQLKYIFNHYIPCLPHDNDGLIFTQNSIPYRSGTQKGINKWKPPEKNTIDFLICPNTKIEISNKDIKLLELYVLFQDKEEKHLLLFDLIQVTPDVLEEVQKEIELLFERLHSQGQTQRVQGVVAECRLEKAENKQEYLAKLFNPEVWGMDSKNVDQFFNNVLLKHVTFGIKQIEQIDLLKEVREQIHLRYGFKSSWKIEKYRTDKTSPNSIRVAQNLIEIINENLTKNDLIEMMEKQQLQQQ